MPVAHELAPKRRAIGVAGLCAAAAVSVGCAATSPVLVEPRTVPGGEVRAQIGGAALAPIGGDTDALPRARETLASSERVTDRDAAQRTVDPGLLVALLARPGVAPVVRGTVGLGDRLEGTLKYGGRDIGVGVRYLVVEHRNEQAGATTFSIGADGRALLRGRLDDATLPGASSEGGMGAGGAFPMVLAWQSDAGLMLAYLATTIGFERMNTRVAFPPLDGADPKFRSFGGTRVWGAATVGLGVGFRRLRVIVELGFERDWLTATLDDTRVNARLWSLAPAFALSWRL